LEILRRAPGSVVHGFDLSPALIELARSRKRSDERAFAFEIADMATAPAPEEPYDRLFSRFGIMFFDDPLAAFANLVRWLASGGRFAFAVWGPPAENPWMTERTPQLSPFSSRRGPSTPVCRRKLRATPRQRMWPRELDRSITGCPE
jgi:SAM-dependent methyltransferase